ncbi:hypothetical protein BT69DRAFT_1196404, partial [Atractiella rhizophila]
PFAASASEFAEWKPADNPAGHRGRYLWTDAFGVLNLLTLAVKCPSLKVYYISLASSLISTVHETLGMQRHLAHPLVAASPAHPLRGGLRIGKLEDEDDPGGDGDGQYHHYLTLWMFALYKMAKISEQQHYLLLAVELAKSIQTAFVYQPQEGRKRMYWKCSIDLSRPLVRSEGNLDPVNGFCILRLLQNAMEEAGAEGESLKDEIEDYREMVEEKFNSYSSSDALDLGMTLWTTHFFADSEQWAKTMQISALSNLKRLFSSNGGYFSRPSSQRLAFRDFGTVLGLRCV